MELFRNLIAGDLLCKSKLVRIVKPLVALLLLQSSLPLVYTEDLVRP